VAKIQNAFSTLVIPKLPNLIGYYSNLNDKIFKMNFRNLWYNL